MQYITSAGLAALALGPVVGLTFRLGDGYGYVPTSQDTNIHGNLVLNGTVSDPTVAGPNIYKYSISLSSILDIEFGEIALFMTNGMLFSLTSYAQLNRKTANPNDLDGIGGGIDIFINSSGISEIDLNAGPLMGELATIDNLPTVSDSRFKLYSLPNPRYPDIPLLAFRYGNYWGFSGYAVLASPTIQATTLTSVRVSGEFPDATGGDIIQFAAGGLQSTVRSVQAAAVAGGSTTFVFTSPLAQLAAVGEPIYIFKPAVGVAVGGSGATGDYLPLNGSGAMSGVLNYGGFRGINLAPPVAAADASTKAYTDAVRLPRVQSFVNTSGTLNLDCNAYDVFHLSLAGNVSLNFLGGSNNQSIQLRIKQDTVGSRTVQLPANVRFNTNVPSYTASTTASVLDKLGLHFDSIDNKFDLLAVVKGIV